MSALRKAGKRSADDIADELRTELRTILHNLSELERPINRFEIATDRPLGVPRHFVCFDNTPHRQIIGLRLSVKEMCFPVEAITDRVALLSATVWHLKDRLHHYAKLSTFAADVERWANSSRDLQICGDIGNHKKHGHNRNGSGIKPQLIPEVIFDTSHSGVVEFFYDGATKHRELLVTDPLPLRFRVDVADGDRTVIGDAVAIIRVGFGHWLPLIRQLGVLDGSGREEMALRQELFPC